MRQKGRKEGTEERRDDGQDREEKMSGVTGLQKRRVINGNKEKERGRRKEQEHLETRNGRISCFSVFKLSTDLSKTLIRVQLSSIHKYDLISS